MAGNGPMVESWTSRGTLERFLALLGAGACSVISLGVVSMVGAQQSLWPLPAMYLIEMSSLCWAGAWASGRKQRRSGGALWAVSGALTGFSILGALSIGLFYLPVAFLFAIAGGMAAWRTRMSPFVALALFAAACAGQVILMLLLLTL